MHVHNCTYSGTCDMMEEDKRLGVFGSFPGGQHVVSACLMVEWTCVFRRRWWWGRNNSQEILLLEQRRSQKLNAVR